MSTQCKRVFVRFLLFALLGLLIEVFFGGISGLFKGSYRMVGKTSAWMMLDYGLLGVFCLPIQNSLKKRGMPLPVRAIGYMLLIFVVEYFSGLVFNKYFGLRIWDYEHLGYDLHGQITLLYTPFWYILGFALEPLHRLIDACAVVMVRGLSGDALMEVDPNLLSPATQQDDLGSAS